MTETGWKLEVSFLDMSGTVAANPEFWEEKFNPLDSSFWEYETGGNLCFVRNLTRARTNLLIQFDGAHFSLAHSFWDPLDRSKNKLHFTCKDPSRMNEPVEVLDETFVPRGSILLPNEAYRVVQHFLVSNGGRSTEIAWVDAENVGAFSVD